MSQGLCAHALPLHNRKGAPTIYNDLQHPRDLKYQLKRREPGIGRVI